MSFGNPAVLWAWPVLLALLAWFLVWAWRRKQQLAVEFIRARLLPSLMVDYSAARQKLRLVILAAAVMTAMLALARPQWGFSWQETTQRGLDVIVAIDTSRSMLATDTFPNRLERARLAALDLMALAKNDRLGLIAFAGTAFLQCPLTLDEEAFRQSVAALNTGIIPQGGTVVSEAIRTAVRSFEESGDNHKVVVLFTDGEDHDETVAEAATAAAQAGIKIFTIGVGTAEGELLRAADETGKEDFIKDAEGNVIKSRLNETLLKQVATLSDGFYLNMRSPDTIGILYEKGLAPLPKSEFSAKLVRRAEEKFYWPLGIALTLLLLELFLPVTKRIRPGGGEKSSNLQAALKVVSLGLILNAIPATASPASAAREFEQGRYENAWREYQKLLKKTPADPKLNYNGGVAAYEAGLLEEAARQFDVSLQSPDLPLQQRAFYNLGNALFRLGEQVEDPTQKQKNWEQSLKSYEGALGLNANDTDAAFNREVVKKKLEELKQQQQQQSSKDQKEDPSQDKKPEPKDDSKPSNESPEKSQADQQQQQQQAKSDSESEKKDSANQSQEQKPKEEQQTSPEQQPAKGNNQETTESGAAANAVPGQMTPQQAQQLLEAQRGEEKTLIFQPEGLTNRLPRIFKDW